jgi:hypothetical protein
MSKIINAKELREKLEGLYKDADLSKQDDKKIIRYATMGDENQDRNKIIYGGVKWVLRSPGNDLLEFYDRQNILLGKDNRACSAIPPSIVYHYRFEHQYPKELFDKRHL